MAPGPCETSLASCPTSPANSEDGGPALDGDALGNEVCNRYIACGAEAAPESAPGFTAAYGARGACWKNESAEVCIQACRDGLAGLHALHPSFQGCAVCKSNSECGQGLKCDTAKGDCVPCVSDVNILFAIDRSGSMSASPLGQAGGPSKWMLTVAAVRDALTSYGARASFGLETFSSTGFSDPECYADAGIQIEPAMGTASAIDSALSKLQPGGGSNIGEAIERAALDTALRSSTQQSYVVLITDGAPNCNSADIDGSATFTIAKISAAASQSPPIHTVVVGFDADTVDDSLTRFNPMANAGQEPIAGCAGTRASPCYYSARDGMTLAGALDQILSKLVNGAGAACH